MKKREALKMLSLVLLTSCCLWFSTSLAAQLSPEPAGYFVDPLFLPDGNTLLATNERHNALYLVSGDDGKVAELIREPGCGFRPSLNPEGTMAGIKVVRDNLETPCLLNLETGALTPLHEPVPVAGEVSFSNNGDIAFTIGDELLIRDAGGEERTVALRTYANIAPLSPDGTWVVFNDEDDQLHILELATGERKQFTNDERGYFGPRWSPDSSKILFSSLDGCLHVFELSTGTTYNLGKGYSPRWSPDGSFVCYHLPEVEELRRVLGSDIFLVRFDGGKRYQLTATEEQLEMCPSFSPDGKTIVYATRERKLFKALLDQQHQLNSPQLVIEAPEPLEVYSEQLKRREILAASSLDVPYIHQVYDTPDWFNGHWACAPATAMMAIVYYRKLPHWDCQPSSPYTHTNHWGRYLCEKYHYREFTYDLQAQDPSSTWAKGGYGYMWSGSHSPHSVMDDYISNHGLTSWYDGSPTWSELVAELDQEYPYPLCVGLTASGHLVLALGYVSGQHTVICNDPYGNKNTPGYPSYDGKDVQYDWPGYNHGNENLNTVYWTVGARGSFLPHCETVVDELALYDAFFMYTAPSQPKDFWWWFSQLSGWDGHMWWTYTEDTADVYYATWTPDLPQTGNYEVFAYIPSANATATSAQYKVYYSGGDQTVPVNQSSYSDEWVSLGTFSFVAGSSGYVRLGDNTGLSSQKLAFDAIKWVEITPTPSPTPTPTPTATPTPSSVGHFDFDTGSQNWTFYTPSPTSAHVSHWDDADSVIITSAIGINAPADESTNYFALWDSLNAQTIAYQADSLYQADWLFSTDRSTANSVPSLRFRLGLTNQKAFAYSRVYPGDWLPLAQTPATTEYELFFEPPISADALFLAFSLIDWTDDFRGSAPAGSVYLDEVTVYRHQLASFTSWQALASFSGADFNSWNSFSDPSYPAPTFTRETDGSLSLTSEVVADRVFGSWDSPLNLFTVSPDHLYRLTPHLSSDPQLGGPDLRLRIHSHDYRYAWYTYYVSSYTPGESALPPASGADYHLYLTLPFSTESCHVSFDLVDFYDSFGGTLTLHSIELHDHSLAE